jgi:hypothetical protein
MIIGTNWFLGFSHTSSASDNLINSVVTPKVAAEIIEVYVKAGVDTIMGPLGNAKMQRAIDIAQDRTGKKLIIVATPTFNVEDTPQAAAENDKVVADHAKWGATFCMPHTCTTDVLVNKRTRRIEKMDHFCRLIRKAGMIPGLSTHLPESVVYADESDLDVETYIQIYNAAGFLMQIEVDWVHRMIWQAKRPVMTIKPMAAGRLHPLVGLAFSWSTIREIDMVTVGTMTPDQARECIDISAAVLERRVATMPLQRTRSKATVEKARQA